MPLKEREILSPADFDAAALRLRLSVSEIAKQTGISRSYLSEFRNGDRKLRPEQQAKLRDFFEAQGVEFVDESSSEEAAAPPVGPASPHPLIQVAPIRYVAIRADLDDRRVRAVFDEIARNDERIAELCSEEVRRGTALFGSSKELTEQSQDQIRELFALLAANYVLVRYATQSENLLSAPPSSDTLHEILLDALDESITRSGAEPEAPQQAEEESAPIEEETQA
jgi:transcriptional regulator with XRE-family HTH domain